MEPTYTNQLAEARKLLRDKGRQALNNPHAMIGRDCQCGTCFCCAAYQVMMEPHVVPSDGRLGVYDLWVNGQIVIHDESFTVCDLTRENLISGRYDNSEMAEVAKRIADAVKDS